MGRGRSSLVTSIFFYLGPGPIPFFPFGPWSKPVFYALVPSCTKVVPTIIVHAMLNTTEDGSDIHMQKSWVR